MQLLDFGGCFIFEIFKIGFYFVKFCLEFRYFLMVVGMSLIKYYIDKENYYESRCWCYVYENIIQFLK